ncbi:MAG TPA: hypothetical protein VKN99_03290 [Polyangia bacterium]|nr:hypothetical protein [Polyangia bacterium]
MKNKLIWIGVGLLLLGAAFGAGWGLGRAGIAAAEGQAQSANADRDRARAELARVKVPLELCRAAGELAKSNFGNAADRIAVAREAARAVPDLRALDSRFAEAIDAAQKADNKARERVEALLAEVAR